MDEEEFDARMKLRPFGTADALRSFAQGRADTELIMTLGAALWGRTPGDLQRQLLAPHPEIPSGFDLADLQKLLQLTTRLTAVLTAQRMRGLPPGVRPTPAVFAGTAGFSEWEARCEIVRRAIDYLEKR